MISIDTNILIRLLTGDDKNQARKARQLFKEEHIYITKTVMLEAEWVLRFAYQFKSGAIAEAYKKLLGQSNVTVEDAQHVARAVSLLDKSMDFADALHLAYSQNHPFATFDKKLKQSAQHAGMNTVRIL